MAKSLSGFTGPPCLRLLERTVQAIKCQKASPGKKHHAPLIPMPIVEEPFHRIAMDIVIAIEQMAEKIVTE